MSYAITACSFTLTAYNRAIRQLVNMQVTTHDCLRCIVLVISTNSKHHHDGVEIAEYIK